MALSNDAAALTLVEHRGSIELYDPKDSALRTASIELS
jgi:hypothetical protein